jgi:hypothetical protein
MILHESKIASIVYTSASDGNVSARTIVPTYVPVPADSVRAIDVSELTEAEQQETAALVAEYKQYTKDYFKAMFKFEDWVEHSKGTAISPKWRTFKVSGIKLP